MITEVTKLLGIQYPVIQGGMAWVAEYHLAAAVSAAGGLGLIGAASAPADWVRQQVREVKKLTDKPFGVNIMLMSPYADEIAKVSSQYIADNMDQSQPKIIQTAYASKTPVNNNILKNTVIGAVLGLFLAAGIVVLGYMLDDTISNADDMEARTGLKVLASLPVDEAEYDGAKSKRRKNKKKQSSKSDDSKSKKRAI